MKLLLLLLLLLLTCLNLQVCVSSPVSNASLMDGSGDEAELELIFPTPFSTRRPVADGNDPDGDPDDAAPAATGAPSFTSTITTTMIRLKDFVLSRVVDFLQDHLLIIIVVTSLLVVVVFIVCCASAMSHKRKLEAYKAPPTRKNMMAEKAKNPGGELQDRPYAVDHVKRVQIQTAPSPKNLRTPSKALVGDKGRDVRSTPRHDAAKAEEAEKRKEQAKLQREEVQRNPGPASGSAQPTCTCHLKKQHH